MERKREEKRERYKERDIYRVEGEREIFIAIEKGCKLAESWGPGHHKF